MKIMQRWKKPELPDVLEALYLAITAVYLLKLSFDTTLFHISWSETFENSLRILTCAVVFLKLGYGQAKAGKEWGICVLVCFLFGLSWVSTEYVFLLDIALLSLGAFGVPQHRILNVGFWVGIYVLVLAMMGSFAGCIPDRVFSQMGYFRHSFGFVYPTDFAAHVVFLALMGWVLYGGNRFLLPVLCISLSAVFIYYYSHAKCSTAVLCLLLIGILYSFLTEKMDRLLVAAMPLGSLLMIGLTLFYTTENTLMVQLDNLLSGRLHFGHSGIETHGIKLLGTAFDQIGAGGGTTVPIHYNFIDISYVLILVRYGLLVLLGVCIQFIWLEKKALDKGLRKLAIAAALAATHSMVEHHLLEIAYNLFLLLPFADFSHREFSREKSSEWKMSLRNKRVPAAGMAVLAICAVSVLVFPRFVTFLRTLVDLLHLDASEGHIRFIGIMTGILSAVGLFLYMLFRTASAFIRRTALPKRRYIGIFFLLCCFLCAYMAGDGMIRRGQADYQDLLDSDRPLMEALSASGRQAGELYVDQAPEIYRREFGWISDGVLAIEGTPSKGNATVIIDDTEELPILLEAGYVYGKLSSNRAVYTNSEPVKEILNKMDIDLTNYYSRPGSVDLHQMAERNHLNMTEAGALILEGTEKSLWHGSGVTIYKGWLRVEYKLRLLEYAADTSEIGIVKIASDWGDCLWGKESIYLSDFNEYGECTYAVNVHLDYNCQDMEFLLLIPDNVRLEIQEITYEKFG